MEPLRAVILDNDETTGSYLIVLSVIRNINKCGNTDRLYFQYILEKLSLWMLKNSIFRPGLIDFLRTLRDLRKANKIDAIVMYTNQYEMNTSLFTSLPRCIEYMFSFLVPGFSFDNILTRPDTFITINNVIPKQFRRVLDLYPDRPSDISQILFFDDLAVPLYIRTDGIDVYCESARVLVEPYSCILYKEDIERCLKNSLNLSVDDDFIIGVIDYYTSNLRNIYSSTFSTDCSYFTDLIKTKYDLDGKNND